MDYLIRFLFCLFKSALAIAIVLALCVGGFVMAMNVSNIYILMSDGMAMRTSVVLGLSDPEELPKFFSESCIQSDAIYQDTTYVDYDMDSFESEVTLLSMHTLPWEDTATATLLQEVPSVVGYLPISKQTPEQLADPNKIPAPGWESGSYALELQKVEDQWKIVSIQQLETQEQEIQEESAT